MMQRMIIRKLTPDKLNNIEDRKTVLTYNLYSPFA